MKFENAAWLCVSDSALRPCSSELARYCAAISALDLKLLFDGERQKLVRRLTDLQATDGALARRHELGERRGVGLNILCHLRLDGQRLVKRRHRILPALERIGGERAARRRCGVVLRIGLGEGRLRGIDVEGDALGLIYQGADLRQVRNDGTERADIEGFEVLAMFMSMLASFCSD